MFGLLESMRGKFCIKEYSCQLSTLEQVFNAFATQDSYAEFNRRLSMRRRSTITE